MRAKTQWTASVGSVVSVLVFGKMLALSVLDVGTPPKLEAVDITSVEMGLGAVGLPATLLVARAGRDIGQHVEAAIWGAAEAFEELQSGERSNE